MFLEKMIGHLSSYLNVTVLRDMKGPIEVNTIDGHVVSYTAKTLEIKNVEDGQEYQLADEIKACLDDQGATSFAFYTFDPKAKKIRFGCAFHDEHRLQIAKQNLRIAENPKLAKEQAKFAKEHG